ncbi:hypothetical protein AJ79_05657 [Helicocarpus griseus UAMH5409]|uniref:Arrestin-like N-terminal domain-containing protein n=1 Tax=Helicocarpus griseus UAMH5409 TaxID=1447875 RepID=A0A2B7XLE1_9EURO|nr:hypothetical protein AJ79_05657 [Helicocarpus griseus UAMH5409]
MTLRIELDNPPKVWSPGSIIQGKVTLDSQQDESIERVTIRFSGKASTKFRTMEGGPYDDRVQLFLYTEQLFSGNYTFSASKRLEWPFRFVFPEKSTNKRYNLGNNKSFCNSGGGSLPPTFLYETDFLTSHEAYCRVKYKLVAELCRPTSFSLSSGRLEAERALTFSPHRSEAIPNIKLSTHPATWIVYSKKILPEYENYEPTRKEKVLSFFSSRDKLPSSSFKIIARLPSKIITGQSIPLTLSAVHQPSLSTAPVVPPIRLRSLILIVKMRTSYCGTSTFGNVHDGSKTDKFTVAHRHSLDIPLEADPVDVSAPLNLLSPGALPPTFVSHLIKRGYSLQAKFEVECAGCRKTVEANQTQLIILGSTYAHLPRGPPPSDAILEMSGAGEQAPAYDFVEKSVRRNADEDLPAYKP